MFRDLYSFGLHVRHGIYVLMAIDGGIASLPGIPDVPSVKMKKMSFTNRPIDFTCFSERGVLKVLDEIIPDGAGFIPRDSHQKISSCVSVQLCQQCNSLLDTGTIGTLGQLGPYEVLLVV